MKAIRAYFREGQVILAEAPPPGPHVEVLVVFPDEPGPDASRQGVLLRDLGELAGILQVGGDAVRDSDDVFER